MPGLVTVGFSIRLDVITAALAHFGAQRAPLEAMGVANLAESALHTLLHATQAAHIDVGRRALEQSGEIRSPRPHAILHVLLWLAGQPREYELLIEQLGRDLLQRPKIGKLGRQSRSKEEMEAAPRRRHRAATALGETTER